jgi:GDP-fucose protein O-fucosyltransferase
MLLLQLISADQKDVLEQQEQHPTSSGNLHPLPQSKRQQRRRRQLDEVHSIAGLDCTDHGGPNLAADEMVYWKDYPSDAHFQSAYAKYGPTNKYLTFEPDEGGWNNQRMMIETMVVFALVMGRTLVIPAAARYDYHDLFPLEAIAQESRESLTMITMQEFLEREGLTGQLMNQKSGQVEFPPENNRTDWNGDLRGIRDGNLFPYLRRASYTSRWDRDACVVAIAKEPGPKGVQQLEQYTQQLLADRMHKLVRMESYSGRPTPVNATPTQRLREVLALRDGICIYGDDMQHAKVLHFIGDQASGGRVLAHFYAFLWLEDWHLDLWTKRFVRDHLRYADDIQCSAARIVQAMRHLAIENGNPQGDFDTFHIRRGDFLDFMPDVNVSASEIYQNTRSVLTPADASSTTDIRGTLYLSTDENDRSYFDALREQGYDLYFLDDFKYLFHDLDASHWGMLEQLVASRGRVFVGTYYSTFTGFINRLRGYHSTFTKGHGKEEGTYEQQQGIILSYYYAPRDQKYVMRQYRSLSESMWDREFPISWRDIDHDVPQEEEVEEE